MNRLPITAALLLLFAGVWLVVKRQETISSGHTEDGDTPEIRSADGRAALIPDSIPPQPDNLQTRGIQRINSTSPPRAAIGIPITPEFVQKLATGPGRTSFALPDGRTAEGVVDLRQTAADGSAVGVSGRLDAPGRGRFHFRMQPAGALKGPLVGAVVLDNEEIAFRVMPGAGGTIVLAALPVDQVICRNFALPPQNADTPQEIPADHPTDIPTPAYQNGIVPLQSRPGAMAVVYLDFDGEEGPHQGWGDFDAASPGMTTAQIRDVWSRVAEDFAPFNLNITTDLQVFLNAPETSRQRCIITPTSNAAPGVGGIAWTASFGSNGDTPSWCFIYYNTKYAAEIISHEVGHTLGLSHDGRYFPSEEYYLGHGIDPVGWAPLMGAGYYKNLSQWSNGDYLSANQQQDDLAIIAANDGVGFIDDDAGNTLATAAILEIFANSTANSQGNIGTADDVDAFRFTTTGGMVALTISPVSAGPNLDVMASLYDSAGELIISSNPYLGIHATLSTTLPAGEYTVHVDGTDRADPVGNGYSDYGSLGQYTITGTIAGAVGPDRFTIAENPLVGAVVGTPQARNDHAGSPLIYQITEGNANSAFTMDPATGVITVADPAALDYETLSTAWDVPSDINLVVTISDTAAPELDESLRVVITVTDVNEAPAIADGTPLVALSHTANGVTLGQLTAIDPDRFDFATLEIIAGDPSGIFELTPTGLLTLNGTLDASVQASHTLTIRATDQGSPPLSGDRTVTVTVIPTPVGFTPGHAYQTIYENIFGANVSDLTVTSAFPFSPNRRVKLPSFATGSRGMYYGSTVRAWLIAPVTGNYRFWIAGDDATELFLSEDGDPANMTNICGTEFFTHPNQWTKYETQRSATYSLTAGQVCYIEARHKQQMGEDHLAVAWEITDPPGTTTIVPRQVIPGRYLSPHFLNNSPQVFAFDVDLYRNSYPGYQVATAFASDPNPADSHRWEITAGNEAGAFAIDPDSGEVSVADATVIENLETSTVVLTLTVTDDGDAPLSDSGPLTIHLLDPSATPTAGLIQEFWDDVPGVVLGDLYALSRFPARPDSLVELGSFETETTLREDFGARIRAYFIPPADDSYTFAISFGNAGSLFLSNNTDPANAIEITAADASQGSLPVPLSAGQRYFIEARAKHGAGDSQLSVTWSRAGGEGSQVIGDAETEPYDSNVAPAFQAPAYTFNLAANTSSGAVVGVLNATDSSFEAIRYAIVSGDPLNAFAIHPKSGAITLKNPGNLDPGTTYQLQVGAQDSGHGRHFAPRETLVPVTIFPPNEPPEFVEDPVNLGVFPAGEPLSLSLTPYVTDPEDTLTFSLISGPPWISLSATGVLSGTPAFADFGPHLLTISADDGHGHTVQGSVNLTVGAPPDIPPSLLTTIDATTTEIIGTPASGTSADAATSDNLYQILGEAAVEDTSALEHRWIFPTTPNRQTTLRIEAHHSANIENDDFQFSISTDGGDTFANAVLVSSTTDDDTPQLFSFTTGPGPSTIIKVVDTNRTSGNTSPDSLFIDLLTLTLAANSVPTSTDAILQVAWHAPVGITIGNVAATDPDADQTLSYNIPRGNEAGLFSITSAGILQVAADITPGSGPFPLIVVCSDNGSPALANYATVVVNVVEPVTAPITFDNLTPTYNGSPQSVIATTIPAGLPVTLTYGDSPEAPTDAGSYPVTATIIHPLHVGSASATLVVGKAPAAVLLAGLSQTYDGSQKSVTVTTSPPGLGYTLTYGPSSDAPTDPGNYVVAATITDSNHTGNSSDTFSITHVLTVTTGQIVTASAAAIPYQSLLNEGTLVVTSGPLHVSGDAVNTGIMRLYGDTVLDVTGTFTNSGVIDTINWNGTLPPAMVNNGTILDRAAHRILSTTTTASQITLRFPAYEGHLYQLETTDDLGAAWSPSGPSFTVSGNPLNPPILQFSNNLDGPTHFYRVAVTPAP